MKHGAVIASMGVFLIYWINMKFHLVSIEPDHFDHAASWYELAELVQYGLLRAGFECSTGINHFIPNRTNIVFGVQHLSAEMEPLLPKDTRLFNTEQLPILSKNFCHQRYMQIRYWAQKGFRFLDYSAENAPILSAWGATEVSVVPLGYVPELDRLKKQPPKYDCLFYGGLNPRRHKLLHEIQELGVNLQFLNGVYGEDRDAFIEKSKIVLNLHLYDAEIFEIVRVNYLMHNNICVLTELNPSTKIATELTDLFVCCSRETLVSEVASVIDQPKTIQQTAANAYDWLRSRPQEMIMKSIFG